MNLSFLNNAHPVLPLHCPSISNKLCSFNYIIVLPLNYYIINHPSPKAALRFQKILYVASECLCECDPPVLKRVAVANGSGGGGKENSSSSSNGHGTTNWNWADPGADSSVVVHEYVSVVQSRADEVSGPYIM